MQGWDLYNRTYDAAARRAGDAADTIGETNALLQNRQIGAKIADGDTAGGINSLLQHGRLPEAMTLDQNNRTNQRQDRTDLEHSEDRQRATVLAGAQGLMRLPEDQWVSAFTGQVAPALEEVGLGHLVGQIAADGITRQELESVIATLGGEVAQPRYLQGSRGALDVIDPYTNGITNVRQPERESAPSGFRWTAEGTSIEPIPGYIQGRASVAASTRAPPRARAAGGGSSGPARSSGPAAPSSRPWERSW